MALVLNATTADGLVILSNTSPLPNRVTLMNNTDSELKPVYQYTVPILLFLCVLSVIYNIRILVSIFWIRRPVSSTLHISLSLAAADAFTSVTIGAGLLFNSLMPGSLGSCASLLLEAFRLTGIIATVGHLLALAMNHYLGILRPLHVRSIMTYRNIAVIIAVLWLLPAAFFFSYFSLVDGQGFQSFDCEHKFIQRYKFRATFSSLFFGPLLLMVFIYTHIFFVLRRQQMSRIQFSKKGLSRPRRSHQQPQNQQMNRNVKAIYTTLLILGSYVGGLIPAVLSFLLICEDCAFHFPASPQERFNMFFVFVFVNLLVILKTLINPIIYAARMKEIKVASQRMLESLRRKCLHCEIQAATPEIHLRQRHTSETMAERRLSRSTSEKLRTLNVKSGSVNGAAMNHTGSERCHRTVMNSSIL